ncbi:armadillo repeat-containing protein 5 [Hypanus sabinus]|uniref:armadillo repeat-containing protein 5 n=1 Tax=Hypanus sabinus TaxID=79690 RepID=UPI0028C3C518|nr:armadillo repeat-containing protein 5 [Hypanus sabinus]
MDYKSRCAPGGGSRMAEQRGRDHREAAVGWERLLGEPGARRLAALHALRRRKPLKEAGGAERFRRSGGLRALLRLLRDVGGTRTGAKELDLGLSVLANYCTEEWARREVQRLGGIPTLVDILKTTTSHSVQNRIARALGNLAIEAENSVIIHQSGAVPLLVCLLSSCEDAGCLQSTVRAVRLLSDTPSHRRWLTTQGCLPPLLPLLSRPEEGLLSATCRALSALGRGLPAPLASRLCGAGAPELLAPLCSHPSTRVRQGALLALASLCGHACVRPALGRAGGVRLLTSVLRAEPSSPAAPSHLRALCLLCREAVNRARVRREGGLGLLLSFLRLPVHAASHPRIVGAFLAFFYDQQALEELAAGGLVPLLVERLHWARGEAGGVAAAEDDEVEGDSFDFPSEGSLGEEEDDEERKREGSSSFLSLRSWLVSEGYIEGPSDLSPAPATEPDPFPPPPLPLSPPHTEDECSTPHLVCTPPPSPETPALLLLSRYSQAEEPPPGLLAEGSLRRLLEYLGLGRLGAPRCFRLLSRLFCNPNCLEPLIRSRAPLLVRAHLIRGLRLEDLRPVREERGGGACRWLRQLGEVLLQNLGAQAESAFGVGTLAHLLLSGTEPDRVSCAIALPLLCRNDSVRRRLLLDHKGLRLLLGALGGGGSDGDNTDPLTAFGAAEAVAELAGTPEPRDGGRGWESESEVGRGEWWAPAERVGEDKGGEPEEGMESEEGAADEGMEEELERVARPLCCPYQEALSESEGGEGDVFFILDCGAKLGALRAMVCSPPSPTPSSPPSAPGFFPALLSGPFLESSLREVHLGELDPPTCLLLLHHLHGCQPPSCPSLWPPAPRPRQPLTCSPLGRSLVAASRYLLLGLAGGLGARALALLPSIRLPELHGLARRLALPQLALLALRRMLRAPLEPVRRPEMWVALLGAEGESEREEVLGCLHGILAEFL